jgi:hypothetical protein
MALTYLICKNMYQQSSSKSTSISSVSLHIHKNVLRAITNQLRDIIKMSPGAEATQIGNGPAESAGPSTNAAESTGVEPAEHAAIDSTPGTDVRSLDDAPIPAPVIPFHELAGIFPVGDDASIRELARRIVGNVPIDPVILYEDKILDSAALYLACLMVGREPTFETYTGDDPVEFLIGRHLSRGAPLSESQRAMAAARTSNLQLGANQHSKGLPIGRASDLLNVGSKSVSRARFVLRHATQDLIAAVDSGRIAVSAAEREIKRRARQASKDAAAISAEAAPQAESPEQADAISEADTKTDSTSRPTTPAPEADDRVSQAETSEPQDAPPATMEPTVWVWPEHIPSAGVTAVVGRSTLVTAAAAKLAATIAAGARFPDGDNADSGKVLWATMNPSSQARDCVYLSAELMTLSSTSVDFLGPEPDEFGLPDSPLVC